MKNKNRNEKRKSSQKDMILLPPSIAVQSTV
jgi:hypothetical protein